MLSAPGGSPEDSRAEWGTCGEDGKVYAIHVAVRPDGGVSPFLWKGLDDAIAARPASTRRGFLGMGRPPAEERRRRFAPLLAVYRCEFGAEVLGTRTLGSEPLGWCDRSEAPDQFRVVTARPDPATEAVLARWGLTHRVEQYGEHTWEGLVPTTAVTGAWMELRRVFPVPLGFPGPSTGPRALDPQRLPLLPGEVPGLLHDLGLLRGRDLPASWEPAFYRPDLVRGTTAVPPDLWVRPAPVTTPEGAHSLGDGQWRDLLGPHRHWVMRADHLGPPSREEAPRDGLPLRCAACGQVLAESGQWEFRPSHEANDIALGVHQLTAHALAAEAPEEAWGRPGGGAGCPSCGGFLGAWVDARDAAPTTVPDEGGDSVLQPGGASGPVLPVDEGGQRSAQPSSRTCLEHLLRPALATVSTRVPGAAAPR